MKLDRKKYLPDITDIVAVYMFHSLFLYLQEQAWNDVSGAGWQRRRLWNVGFVSVQ